MKLAHKFNYFGTPYYDGEYQTCSKCQLEIQPGEEWDFEIDACDDSCSYFHTKCPDWPLHIDHTQTCIRCLSSLGEDHRNWDFSTEVGSEGQDQYIYFHQNCLSF